MLKIAVLHGPNMDLLGQREPGRYGAETLSEINGMLEQQAKALEAALESFQSANESDLISEIHRLSAEGVDGFIVNPAGLTHTSVALRDALLASSKPFVEVHMTNIAAREDFRHRSLFSDIALGVISGFGSRSYRLALDALIAHLSTAESTA